MSFKRRIWKVSYHLIVWYGAILCGVNFLFNSCQNNNPTSYLETLSFSSPSQSDYIVHPFQTDSCLVLVVPSFWNMDQMSVRSCGHSFSLEGHAISDSWSSISLNGKNTIALCLKSKEYTLKICKSNLDAICIKTESGTLGGVTKTESESGELLAISKDGEVLYKGALSSLKGRGNTTWLNSDKKPYKIKLKKKASLFGLRKGKKFNLLAEAFDDTKMHNWLALHVAEDFGIRFPIHCRYVSLWANGQYQGIYLLTEPVEVGEDGIDISDLEEETKSLNKKKIKSANMQKFDKMGTLLPASERMTQAYCSGIVGAKNPEDITGGYVVEFLPWTKDPDNKFNTSFASLCLKSPKYPTIEQMHYIQQQMENMLASVIESSEDTDSSSPSFLQYLNIDSYARYYLLQEAMYGCDACYASVYHVKDRSVVDSLFYAAPAWDFDISMKPFHFENEAQSYILRPSPNNKILLFPDLYKYKCFQDTVYSLYCQELSPVLHHYFEESTIDSLSALLQTDVWADSYRWRKENTFSSGVEDLKRFMNLRIAFMDKDMEASETDYYTVTIDKGVAISPAHCNQWHVHKGDTFTLMRFPSYFYTLEAIEDEFGNTYSGSFVPTSDVNLHYRWRESTKVERAMRKVRKWVE